MTFEASVILSPGCSTFTFNRSSYEKKIYELLPRFGPSFLAFASLRTLRSFCGFLPEVLPILFIIPKKWGNRL
jgi:hypothetical protein